MRYFVHIAYNGVGFNGWQRQLENYTVQETIENQLSSILKTPITIVGCGRTDAKVSASQYFFHFNVEKEWDFDLLFRLNKNLPHEISVYNIVLLEENRHARLDVTERTYDYFFHTYKAPFLIDRSSRYPIPNLNIENMKKACDLITKYDDFHSFCKTPEIYKHTICQVTEAKLFSNTNQDMFRFRITADRFIRGMVRLLIGKLIEVGKGKFTVAEFEEYLQKNASEVLHTPAFPQGLYLSNIEYPYLSLPQRTEFFSFMEQNVSEEI